MNQYAASEVLVIDMDNTDVVKSNADAIMVCNAVEEKLNQILKVEKAQIG